MPRERWEKVESPAQAPMFWAVLRNSSVLMGVKYVPDLYVYTVYVVVGCLKTPALPPPLYPRVREEGYSDSCLITSFHHSPRVPLV